MQLFNARWRVFVACFQLLLTQLVWECATRNRCVLQFVSRRWASHSKPRVMPNSSDEMQKNTVKMCGDIDELLRLKVNDSWSVATQFHARENYSQHANNFRGLFMKQHRGLPKTKKVSKFQWTPPPNKCPGHRWKDPNECGANVFSHNKTLSLIARRTRMHACIHVCVWTHTHIYNHIYIYLFIYLFTYLCIHIDLNLCIFQFF